MRNYYSRLLLSIALCSGAVTSTYAQKKVDSAAYYNQVKTFLNPVLPGDHPDPTLLKVGNDFYHCGSSFHFTPYLPIYHSTDLVHWEVISRVVMPENAAQVSDRPSQGIWQGAITYFYGSWWIYFSSNGQWFSKANSPKGPWSKPVKVETNPATGSLGYDNSIFVDDDGKPYMVIKNGQKVNRLQELGKDGQLTSSVINLDWINAKLQYSWAEGPVMNKRNGFYYYYPAGDVSGGQYVLRASALTADSTKWVRQGNFFKPITDAKASFRIPNHVGAPVQLADGTWWTIAQSYQKVGGDDWSGMGRQTSLYQVTWEGDRPWGAAPVSTPVERPNLPQSGILWRSVSSDYFNSSTLGMAWHFLSRKANASYSLTARKGWIRLTPDKERTHVMQKETDHYYTAVTKVDVNPTDSLTKAGIYLTNGNQRVFVQLYSGIRQGNKEIVFKLDTAVRHIANTFGNVIWLKVQRKAHELTAYCSGDGNKWVMVGKPISAVSLDKVQPNYNSWVGTSVGLFAEGAPADFDFFICKDGFTELPAVGYSNYYGVTPLKDKDNAVTNTSNYGGWFMISGVDLGDEHGAAKIEVLASSSKVGKLQIWLDDLKDGKLIATVPVTKTTGNNWKTFAAALKNVKGHHDVFVKFPAGAKQAIAVKNIRFVK
ncbi:MAG: family 43 glycosylhydrolase [Mucilaginibacter sp.]